MPRLTADKWEEVRADYESGMSQASVAIKYGVARSAVQKHIGKEGWSQDIEPQIQRKVAEKVAGLVAGETSKKKSEALDREAERRAEVIRRHMDEPNACRERLYAAITAHKASQTKEEKILAFEDLKAAKIASEAMQIIENMERKTYRLEPSENKNNGAASITVIGIEGIQKPKNAGV